jgi:hypothetical protein
MTTRDSSCRNSPIGPRGHPKPFRSDPYTVSSYQQGPTRCSRRLSPPIQPPDRSAGQKRRRGTFEGLQEG